MNIPRCGTKAIDLQDLPGMVSFSAVFEACGATHRPGESSQLMKPFTQTHDRRHERPKETNMTHLKTFAFGLILLPAMAIAQAGAEGYYKEGQPIPGARTIRASPMKWKPAAHPTRPTTGTKACRCRAKAITQACAEKCGVRAVMASTPTTRRASRSPVRVTIPSLSNSPFAEWT